MHRLQGDLKRSRWIDCLHRVGTIFRGIHLFWWKRNAVNGGIVLSQSTYHFFSVGPASPVLGLTQQDDDAAKACGLLLEQINTAIHPVEDGCAMVAVFMICKGVF